MGHRRRRRQHRRLQGRHQHLGHHLRHAGRAEGQGQCRARDERRDRTPRSLYNGGEKCTGDKEILKKVRDTLVKAKPELGRHGIRHHREDGAPAISRRRSDWNGSALRQRLQNPAIHYGYPKEGFVLLERQRRRAQGRQECRERQAVPELHHGSRKTPAMISAFHRYANGIAGSDEFMPADMKDAPEVVVPEEFKKFGDTVAAPARPRCRSSTPRSGPNCRSRFEMSRRLAAGTSFPRKTGPIAAPIIVCIKRDRPPPTAHPSRGPYRGRVAHRPDRSGRPGEAGLPSLFRDPLVVGADDAAVRLGG